MQRRAFLGNACAAGAAAVGAMAGGARAAEIANKQYLDLRLVRLPDAAHRERFEAFLAKAAIPAWNRAGVSRVGVFADLEGKNEDLRILLPYASAADVVAVRRKAWPEILARADVADVVRAEKKAPAYTRIESSLMLAFDGVPKIEVPEKTPGRIFQLRTYESHSQAKALKKVEMFNEGGELAIFREVGMNPVFFGETLIGPLLPNLTYMLTFKTMDDKNAAWKKFLAHPNWKKLSKDPAYKDTVSTITNLMLKAASCSQI